MNKGLGTGESVRRVPQERGFPHVAYFAGGVTGDWEEIFNFGCRFFP